MDALPFEAPTTVSSPSEDPRRSAPSARATRDLALSLLLGLATAELFFRAEIGLNFFIWDLIILLASLWGWRRKKISGPSFLVVTASCVIGFSVVRFASSWALVISVPSVLFLLAILPAVLRSAPSLEAFGRAPVQTVRALRHPLAAFRKASELPTVLMRGPNESSMRATLRGILVGVPTSLVFIGLLSADPAFDSLVSGVVASLGEVGAFVLWTLASSCAFAVSRMLARSTALPSSETVCDARVGRWSTKKKSVIPEATWAVVLGQVGFVFAAFVAVNLRHLFAGVSIIQNPGETYSGYLHSGFSSLLIATALSVSLVLKGHALLRPADACMHAPVPGGPLLRTLETSLLALTMVTLASCYQRLAIYQDAYGATEQRLLVAFVELFVLLVLVLTIAKSHLRSWPGYGGAVLTAGIATAVFATGFNAEKYIANTNLDRAMAGASLDELYLATLTGDARGALEHPYIKAHPQVGERLRESYLAAKSSDPRSFRGLYRLMEKK